MTEWFCETKIKDGKPFFINEGTLPAHKNVADQAGEAPAEGGIGQKYLLL
jgi:hypothetical protein